MSDEQQKALTVEELQALTPSQLKNLIQNLEGEDKVIAETVLNKKLEKTKNIRNIPGVQAEVEHSKETNGDTIADQRKKEREEARAKAAEEKLKVKAQLEESKREKELARQKVRELAEASKEQRMLEKQKEEELREKKKAERAEALEKAKLERAEKAKLKESEKEDARKAKIEEENKRVAAIAERLKAAGVETKAGSKTDVIRELMIQGKSNPEIAEITGFGIKFVCDNVWRIMRQLESKEWLLKRKEEKAASEASQASEEKEETQI